MSILAAYASRHSATRGIAERITEKLTAAGQDAEARSARTAVSLAGHETFVVGSAVCNRHWGQEASDFVRGNSTVLAERPVWLFSSGPLGTEKTDAEGRDVTVSAGPTEIAEFREAIRLRDHRVFFGALLPGTLGLGSRLLRSLTAARAMLPEGDFRDWSEIEAWADAIAGRLAQSGN